MTVTLPVHICFIYSVDNFYVRWGGGEGILASDRKQVKLVLGIVIVYPPLVNFHEQTMKLESDAFTFCRFYF